MRTCINQIAVKERREGFAHAGTVHLSDDGLREGPDGSKKFAGGSFRIFRCRKHFLKVRAGGKDGTCALKQHDADFRVAFGIRECLCEGAEHVARQCIAPLLAVDGEMKNPVLKGGLNAHDFTCFRSCGAFCSRQPSGKPPERERLRSRLTA